MDPRPRRSDGIQLKIFLKFFGKVYSFIKVWKHGYEQMEESDAEELLFNRVLSKQRSIIGALELYLVVCYGHPELETYYCRMCKVSHFSPKFGGVGGMCVA